MPLGIHASSFYFTGVRTVEYKFLSPYALILQVVASQLRPTWIRQIKARKTFAQIEHLSTKEYEKEFNPYSSGSSVLLDGILSGILTPASPVYGQNVNQTTAAATIDQLASNLTQARESIASGNATVTTAQLTSIIGELSDILGTVTSDQNAPTTDEYTHFFAHKGHSHTVTHHHPHNPSHHHDWFETHHIFNPSDCKPGLMC
jgi:hypothetical protein